MHYVLYIIALLSLSQSANLARLAEAPPELLGFWRLLIASLVLAPWALWKGRPFFSKRRHHAQAWSFVIASGVLFYLHLWTFKFSAQHTTIANCMILFSTNPLFTALGSVFFMKEHFERRWLTAYFLGFLSVSILMSHSLKWQPENLHGDLAALASAVFFSAYLLTGRAGRKIISNISYMTVAYFVAALGFFLTVWIRDIPFTGYPPQAWFAILGLVAFPTFLGHALFTYLFPYLNINWMSCGKLAEPILAAAVAVLLFGETVTTPMLISFFFTTVAMLILFQPWKSRNTTIKVGGSAASKR